MRTILVVYAVKEEYIPLTLENIHIIPLRTGVGKTKSAYHLTKAILENKPQFVLNIGTAGTISHNIGDIFIINSFIDRDYEAIKLPGIEQEIDGESLIANHPKLIDFVCGYSKTGICSTGDSFVTEVSSLSGDVVDMESFAQAYVCRELSVPYLSIKYVTDIIGQNSVEHWENKLADARMALAEWFDKNNVLSFI